MQYTSEIIIDLPRDRVIELIDNADNMKHWQKGLISYEFTEGEPGQNGSKMKLFFEMGKRKVEMVETIVENKFPEEFHATYEAKGVFNDIKNKFIVVDDNTTKWIQENEFQFSGFMKIMSAFMKGAFSKQTLKTQKDFKEFAENA